METLVPLAFHLLIFTAAKPQEIYPEQILRKRLLKNPWFQIYLPELVRRRMVESLSYRILNNHQGVKTEPNSSGSFGPVHDGENVIDGPQHYGKQNIHARMCMINPHRTGKSETTATPSAPAT